MCCVICKSDIELSTRSTTLIPNSIYQIGSLGIPAKPGETFVWMHLLTYMLPIYVWGIQPRCLLLQYGGSY